MRILLWTLLVLAAVLAEVTWFAEPDVDRGDVSSIERHLVNELRDAANDRRLGSAALVLIDRGKIVAEHSFGTPVDLDRTRFHVASISKAVTAWGVMRLVQEGRADQNVVRPYLTHTAGGTFSYSGEGYMALQRMIEHRTGQRFEEFMQAAVLRPLRMTQSSFENCSVENLAPNFDQRMNVVPVRRITEQASAGLCTTPRDLARFALAFVHENPVLRRDTLNAMMTAQPGTEGSWGLGLTLFAPGVVGHDGGTAPAWGAELRVHPASGNGFLVMSTGGRGAINRLGSDWVYWQTGTLPLSSRRELVYQRLRPASIAIAAGAAVLILLRFRRARGSSAR